MMRMSLTSRGHICSPIIILHPSISRFALSRPSLCFCQMILHTWAHTCSPRSAGVREERCGRWSSWRRRDRRRRDVMRDWGGDVEELMTLVRTCCCNLSFRLMSVLNQYHRKQIKALWNGFLHFSVSSAVQILDFGFIYNESTKSHPQIRLAKSNNSTLGDIFHLLQN